MINIRNTNSLALTNLQPRRLFFFFAQHPRKCQPQSSRVIQHPARAAAGLRQGCEHFLDLSLLQLYLQKAKCT